MRCFHSQLEDDPCDKFFATGLGLGWFVTYGGLSVFAFLFCLFIASWLKKMKVVTFSHDQLKSTE